MLAQAGRSGRAAIECTGGKQFYVCTAGPFRGCCSIDPCTDGICPDDDSSESTTKQVTRSSTTTTTSTTQTSQTTLSTSDETSTSTTSSSSSSSASTSTSSSISSTSDTASTPSTSTSSSIASTTTAPQTAYNASSSSSSSSNAGTIGGAVGGVLAAILLGILLFFCLKRRRKKTKVKVKTMDRSTSTESLRSRERAPPTSHGPSSVGAVLGVGAGAGAGAEAQDNRHSTDTAPPNETPISSLGDLGYYNNGLPSTVSSLTLSTASNSTTPSTKATLEPLLIPPNRESLTAANHHLSPQAAGYIPELNDTGFRWGRLELAEQPCSELINQPRTNYPRSPGSQYQNHFSAGSETETTNAVNATGSGSGAGLSQGTLTSPYTARKIVTRDGIIMSANLDRMSCINEEESTSPVPSTRRPSASSNSPGPASRSRFSAMSAWRAKKGKAKQNDHVMSFMEYDDLGSTGASIEMIETDMSEHRTSTGTGNGTWDLSGLGLNLANIENSQGRNGSSVREGFASDGFHGVQNSAGEGRKFSWEDLEKDPRET